MNHKTGFNALSRSTAHRRAMSRNMVTSLFRYERITTTKAKALEVRKAAEKFGMSKSTVYTYVTSRLKEDDWELYKKVREVLDYNTSQRSIRGGMATKAKKAQKP